MSRSKDKYEGVEILRNILPLYTKLAIHTGQFVVVRGVSLDCYVSDQCGFLLEQVSSRPYDRPYERSG